MKQISILGCGWLGLPLAEKLIENNFEVNGSTTTEAKFSALKDLNIAPFMIKLEADETLNNPDEIASFLKNSDILIIDIPPKIRSLENDSISGMEKDFVLKIKNLIPFIRASTVKKVLFVSSTSVYGDANFEVSERTIPNPDSESGRQLLEVENMLSDNKSFKTTILRFGGLIGNDRHPIFFLSGKKNLANPNAPINLIHQEDCIGIILKIIAVEFWDETLNAVAPFHPSRKEYYTQKAMQLNVPLPDFNVEKSTFKKIISSDKVIRTLQYKFIIDKF